MRRWQKTGLTIDEQICKNQKTAWKNAMRDCKKEHYKSKLENSNSCKQLFNICNELLGKNENSPLPNSNSDEELSDRFSHYFTEKIQLIRQNLDKFDLPVDNNSFVGDEFTQFKEVSESYVRSLILNAPRKHCALDPLPSSLLISTLNETLPTITNIINLSLATGVVPEDFKFALVKPLLKKQNLDHNEMKNFRPVSNLPFLSKILEKVVLSQLKNHLELNNLREPLQSAYRQNHSTETALLKVMNDIVNNADANNVNLLCLLDLSAAFDTIDHDILMRRLTKTYGIGGTVSNWFRSYLSDRYQAVVVNGVRSSKELLQYGVPQGSVLGPVLFTLYMQPLSSLISSFNLNYHFYADDTQLYDSQPLDNVSSMIETFEKCIKEIKIWMNENRLKLNEDKTEVILCGNKTQICKVPENCIKINDQSIKFSLSVRNLGVFIDSSLSMANHISHLIKIMYLELRRINSIRNFLSKETTALLINALVLSKLDYCNSLLVNISNDKLQCLQKVQNNAARMILKKTKFSSATPLLNELHWLPVKKRIMYKMCTIVFKCLNDQCPVYLSDLVKKYCPSRCLRSSDDPTLLVKPKTSRKIGERSFSFSGPALWNSLPQCLREQGSIETFKSHLKTYLFTLDGCPS